MKYSFLGAIAFFAASTGAASAGVIFTDFGPAQTVQNQSWVVGDTFPNPAMLFISPGDYSVSQIDVALNGGNMSAVSVSLHTDFAAGPGALLGQWNVTNIGVAPAIYTISGISGVNVVAGFGYWLQITTADPALGWPLNDQGIFGLVYDPPLPTGNNVLGAFDILGSPVDVPEPFSLSLFASGVVGAAVVRRRRRRADA